MPTPIETALHTVCLTPTSCAVTVVGTFASGLADAIRGAVGQIVTSLFGWWATSSSINLDQPLVHTTQTYVTTWIAVPVAVLAVLAAVGWGVLGGSHAWIGGIARGILVFTVTATGSIPIVVAVQAWAGALSKGLLRAVPTRDLGQRVIGLLDPTVMSPFALLFWGVILLITATVQYLMMLFRDGAVLVLTAVLPLAAAGQFSRGSMFWLPKVAGWLAAFLFFKPAAALIYYLGLSLIGEGHGVQSLATGVCMMVSAVLALPAMLRLVTFAVAAAPLGSTAMGASATLAGIGASAAQTAAIRSGQPPSAPTGPSGAGPAGAGPAGAGMAGAGVAGAGPAVAGATVSAAASAVSGAWTPGPTP